MDKKGLVYLFEGDGKGKTSAALGVTLRMLLAGKTVVWISWYKNSGWKLSEMELATKFKKTLKMHWMGEGFYLKDIPDKKVMAGKTLVVDTAKDNEHKIAASQAVLLAKKVLGEKGTPDLLVLDESIRAVEDGLITERELLDVLVSRGNTHIVLTGHRASLGIRNAADLVTRMQKIKHPFDLGVMAVKGLDF